MEIIKSWWLLLNWLIGLKILAFCVIFTHSDSLVTAEFLSEPLCLKTLTVATAWKKTS